MGNPDAMETGCGIITTQELKDYKGPNPKYSNKKELTKKDIREWQKETWDDQTELDPPEKKEVDES